MNDGFFLSYYARFYRKRVATGFIFLFFNLNPLVNLIINHRKYHFRGHYHVRDNWYRHHYISHEYKGFLQHSYEDWVGIDLPVPIKLMRVDVRVRYPIQLFRLDAHPNAHYTSDEIEDRKQKQKMKKKMKKGKKKGKKGKKNDSKDSDIDTDSIPGTMMDYKYVDLFDGYVKYRAYKNFGTELVPRHTIKGMGGYKPFLHRYSFFKSKMPQSYVHVVRGCGKFRCYHVDSNLFKYFNSQCYKMNGCNYNLSIQPKGIYLPDATVYPRTYGTFKFKMKGQGGEAFGYNFRGVKHIKVWTIKHMDIIIKSKDVKFNNTPYCMIDGDYSFQSPSKTLMAAPCTTIASLADGREHFIHSNSVGLFTRWKFRLVDYRRMGGNKTYLLKMGKTHIDRINVPYDTYRNYIAKERKHKICRIIYFYGDEHVACFYEDQQDYHRCLDLDYHYKMNYINEEEVTIVSDNTARVVNNSPMNVIHGKTFYFEKYVSIVNLKTTFKIRENFYFTEIYLRFLSAPKKIMITCEYYPPGKKNKMQSMIVYSNFDNQSKVISSSLLVSPCKIMHLKFWEFDKVLSRIQTYMQFALTEFKLFSDAKPVYWNNCKKDQDTMHWYQDVYRHPSSRRLMHTLKAYSRAKQQYDKSMGNFLPKYEIIMNLANKTNALKSQANNDTRMIIRDEATIKKMRKKIDYLRNLVSGGTASQADSGVGYSPMNPALNCEELQEMYPKILSGYYYFITLCTKKAFKAYCDFTRTSGPKMAYLANLNMQLNTWLEQSKGKLKTHDQFLLACGMHGLFPWDIKSLEEMKTLSLVAKQFLVAYYSRGGIPIAWKQSDSKKINKWFSLDRSVDITKPLNEFAELLGQPIRDKPLDDTLWLADSQILSGSMGSNSKTYAIPCSLQNPRKITRLSCKSTLQNLNLDLGASTWVACPKRCFNKVVGNMLYSDESYLCSSIMHSEKFVKKGKIFFAEIQRSQSSLYDFKGSANSKGQYAESKKYKVGRTYFIINPTVETCATDIYSSKQETSFIQRLHGVHKLHKFLNQYSKFRFKDEFDELDNIEKTLGPDESKKVHESEIVKVKETPQNSNIQTNKIDTKQSNDLIEIKDKKENEQTISPLNILEPQFESHKTTEIDQHTHAIHTPDYLITVTNESGDNRDLGMQKDMDEYFDYIREAFFQKNHKNSKKYTPKLEIPYALEQVQNILYKYPNIADKYDIPSILMKDHVRNYTLKQLNRKDFNDLTEIVKYIRFLLTNQAIKNNREMNENKNLRINKTNNNIFREEIIDNDSHELVDMLDAPKNNQNYIQRFKQFHSRFFQQKNDIYDLMRFTFTSILDQDDDRADKYYSTQQRILISNFKDLNSLELDEQIEQAVSYILENYAIDKMNFNYLTAQFDKKHKQIGFDLSEEEWLRNKKWYEKAVQNSMDAESIGPTLNIINSLAVSYKRELKMRWIFNYDFYMKIFSYFNFFFDEELIAPNEPLSRDFDYIDLKPAENGPSNWLMTKKDVAPHAKGIVQKSQILARDRILASVLHTRYRMGYEFYYVASFKADQGVVGILWKYIDIYNFYSIEFDFKSRKTVKFIWNFNNKPFPSQITDYDLIPNVWYTIVIKSIGNSITVYLKLEESFDGSQMTEQDIQKFIKKQEPFMQFYHDALRNGKLGFYCNNCYGTFIDYIHVVQQECIKPEDTAIMKLSSMFSDRYFEPYPGRLPSMTWTLSDSMQAIDQPSKWVFTKGAYGTKKSLAQMKRIKLSNLILPASYLIKSTNKVNCKNYCEYSIKFMLHEYGGSITYGFKADSVKKWYGVTVQSLENKGSIYLLKYKKGIKTRKKYAEPIKFTKDKWYEMKISLIDDKVGVFMKSSSMDWKIIFYETIFNMSQDSGSLLIGSNNMLAHFSDIKLNKIFVLEENQTKLIKRINDSKKKDYRFSTKKIKETESDLDSKTEKDSKSIDTEIDSARNNSNLDKSLTAEIPDINMNELPTELVGLHQGMVESNVDSLTPEQKLVVDQCVKLSNLESRNAFCQSYAGGFQVGYCMSNFCASCCKMTLSPSDYSSQKNSCENICNRVKVYDDVSSSISKCVEPVNMSYTVYNNCRGKSLCFLAVCQSCCEGMKSFARVREEDMKKCKADCYDKFPVKTDKSFEYIERNYKDKKYNPLKEFKTMDMSAWVR